MSLAVPIALIVFPTIYDRQGKFRRLGKFCLKPRTNLIFCGFYTVLWITCGIAITVHANNPDNCNLFDDKQDDFGDDYRNAWPTQVLHIFGRGRADRKEMCMHVLHG